MLRCRQKQMSRAATDYSQSTPTTYIQYVLYVRNDVALVLAWICDLAMHARRNWNNANCINSSVYYEQRTIRCLVWMIVLSKASDDSKKEKTFSKYDIKPAKTKTRRRLSRQTEKLLYFTRESKGRLVPNQIQDLIPYRKRTKYELSGVIRNAEHTRYEYCTRIFEFRE